MVFFSTRHQAAIGVYVSGMKESDWLNELKAGDTVFMTQSYGQCAIPVPIIRITDTMIIVAGAKNYAGEIIEARFRRRDGYQITDDKWHAQCLIKDTPELRERYAVDLLKQRVNRLRNKLSTPNDRKTLEKMVAALSPFVKEEKGNND